MKEMRKMRKKKRSDLFETVINLCTLLFLCRGPISNLLLYSYAKGESSHYPLQI